LKQADGAIFILHNQPVMIEVASKCGEP
jgi:hypothetical protein